MGRHQLGILHHAAGNLQLAAQLRRQIQSGLRGPLGHGRQGRRQGGRPLTLLSSEVAVAGAAGETIGLAHGGAALDHHRHAQIVEHPAQDHQLLPVLLAEQQPLGPHQAQQPQHHGGHTIEMPGAAGGAEAALQVEGGQHPGQTLRPRRLHQRLIRREQGRSPGLGGQLGIAVEIAGVAVEVFSRTELQRIDVDTDEGQGRRTAAALRRPADQLLVTGMQSPHGGDEMKRARALPAPRREIGEGAEQLHGAADGGIKKPTRQIGGWVGRA